MENKIMELFEKKKRVSMMNDIIPIVMEEFKNEGCSTELDDTMQEYIRQQLYAVHIAGYPMVAVPVFDHDYHGGVRVVDFIYELVSCDCEFEIESK